MHSCTLEKGSEKIIIFGTYHELGQTEAHSPQHIVETVINKLFYENLVKIAANSKNKPFLCIYEYPEYATPNLVSNDSTDSTIDVLTHTTNPEIKKLSADIRTQEYGFLALLYEKLSENIKILKQNSNLETVSLFSDKTNELFTSQPDIFRKCLIKDMFDMHNIYIKKLLNCANKVEFLAQKEPFQSSEKAVFLYRIADVLKKYTEKMLCAFNDFFKYLNSYIQTTNDNAKLKTFFTHTPEKDLQMNSNFLGALHYATAEKTFSDLNGYVKLLEHIHTFLEISNARILDVYWIGLFCLFREQYDHICFICGKTHAQKLVEVFESLDYKKTFETVRLPQEQLNSNFSTNLVKSIKIFGEDLQ